MLTNISPYSIAPPSHNLTIQQSYNHTINPTISKSYNLTIIISYMTTLYDDSENGNIGRVDAWDAGGLKKCLWTHRF